MKIIVYSAVYTQIKLFPRENIWIEDGSLERLLLAAHHLENPFTPLESNKGFEVMVKAFHLRRSGGWDIKSH